MPLTPTKEITLIYQAQIGSNDSSNKHLTTAEQAVSDIQRSTLHTIPGKNNRSVLSRLTETYALSIDCTYAIRRNRFGYISVRIY